MRDSLSIVSTLSSLFHYKNVSHHTAQKKSRKLVANYELWSQLSFKGWGEMQGEEKVWECLTALSSSASFFSWSVCVLVALTISFLLICLTDLLKLFPALDCLNTLPEGTKTLVFIIWAPTYYRQRKQKVLHSPWWNLHTDEHLVNTDTDRPSPKDFFD